MRPLFLFIYDQLALIYYGEVFAGTLGILRALHFVCAHAVRSMSGLRYFHDITDYLPVFLAWVDICCYGVWLLLSLTRAYATADARNQGILALMLLNLFFITYAPQYGIPGFFITGASALISSMCGSVCGDREGAKKKD